VIIEKCEGKLHKLNFFGCRVRLRDDYAVIELAEVDFERFAEPQTRLAVSDFFNDFNIEKVYVDVRTRPPVES
jgi:PP-loop superfamily ATP-utilizing enzyme